MRLLVSIVSPLSKFDSSVGMGGRKHARMEWSEHIACTLCSQLPTREVEHVFRFYFVFFANYLVFICIRFAFGLHHLISYEFSQNR